MRRGFGFFGLIATVLLLVGVGVVAYNVGWTDGFNTHVPAGTAVAPYYYGPNFWGAGFGILGLLWFLFVLFVLFGVLRLVFFGRRMMGGGWRGGWGGGWGHGHGYGGKGIPSGLDERMQEWHRKAHGEGSTAPQGPTGSPTPPPPSTV